MRSDIGTLGTLALQFAILSLFAVGGANAAIPEMHRLAVDVMGWMNDRQFSDIFAISQLSPGPNVIIVTLVGYQAAGIAGALIATAGMCGPTCVVAYGVGRIWERFKDAPWRTAIQDGLVPVSLGLIAASALIITRAADHGPAAYAVTVAVAAIAFMTRLNPLWVFAAAALLGLVGWI